MRCAGCGCTEDRGCPPVGCYWTSGDPALCSRCFQPLLGTELADDLAPFLLAEAFALLDGSFGIEVLDSAEEHALRVLELYGGRA